MFLLVGCPVVYLRGDLQRRCCDICKAPAEALKRPDAALVCLIIAAPCRRAPGQYDCYNTYAHYCFLHAVVSVVPKGTDAAERPHPWRRSFMRAKKVYVQHSYVSTYNMLPDVIVCETCYGYRTRALGQALTRMHARHWIICTICLSGLFVEHPAQCFCKILYFERFQYKFIDACRLRPAGHVLCASGAQDDRQRWPLGY